jgi:hypothetical protein
VTIAGLARRIKTPLRLPGGPSSSRSTTDVELRIPNVDKARCSAAEVELDEGFEKTIAWYRARALTSA